jgi:hypothetical protein
VCIDPGSRFRPLEQSAWRVTDTNQSRKARDQSMTLCARNYHQSLLPAIIRWNRMPELFDPVIGCDQ